MTASVPSDGSPQATVNSSCEEAPRAEDESVQRPLQSSSLAACVRRDPHLKCALLTLLILSCVATMAWCSMAEVTRIVVNFSTFPIAQRHRVSPCDNGYFYLPLIFSVSLYCLYIIECWRAAAKLAFEEALRPEDMLSELERFREALPIIWWKSVSYHYVRRSRQMTRVRNGIASTSTHVFYERINRPGVCGSFAYGHCGVKDISKKLIDLEHWPALRIRVTKGFAFANLDAASEFEDQRSRFFRDQERRDDYIEMREGLDLLGAVNFNQLHFNVIRTSGSSWFVGPMFYWVSSILLLSWPARLVIEANTCNIDYQVTKLFGCNQTEIIGRGCPRPSSRMSTVDSSEILANCSLAPSYSEAALMLSAQVGLGSPATVMSPTTAKAAEAESEARRASQMDRARGSLSPLRSSISATVLSNGQLGYLVAALPGDGSSPDDCPPGYVEAVTSCRAVSGSNSRPFLSLSRLKRSFTDKDFPEKTLVGSKRRSSTFFGSLREACEQSEPIDL